MKLWVLGETTSDPTKWSLWSEWTIIMAMTSEKARELSEDQEAPLTEIDMTKECILCSQGERQWGDDL